MSSVLASVIFGAAALAAAQPLGSAPADVVVRARTALQSGRARDAVDQVDAVLGTTPANADAAAVKVEALLALAERDKALDAYDAWARAARREQLPVLGRIARAELAALTSTGPGVVQADATAALAVHGDAAAKTSLETDARATPPTVKTWPALAALARQGDARAAERIVRAVRESTGSGRVEAIRALAAAKAPGAESVLRESLATRDAMLQAAAAEAVATLRLKALVPDLQKVAANGEQFARFVAAVALAELGATGGEALIEAGLTSTAPDMQLRAADALRARGVRTWGDHVKPLLENLDGFTRFEAAERYLAIDPQAALKVLTPGTTDPNFTVRAEVARILTAWPALDVAELRRLLRDGAPQVRLLAARSILERQAAKTAGPVPPIP